MTSELTMPIGLCPRWPRVHFKDGRSVGDGWLVCARWRRRVGMGWIAAKFGAPGDRWPWSFRSGINQRAPRTPSRAARSRHDSGGHSDLARARSRVAEPFDCGAAWPDPRLMPAPAPKQAICTPKSGGLRLRGQRPKTGVNFHVGSHPGSTSACRSPACGPCACGRSGAPRGKAAASSFDSNVAFGV